MEEEELPDSVISELLLKRYLYLGSFTNCYKPSTNDKKVDIKETMIIDDLVESGQANLPLETVTKANKSGYANKTALQYALNKCIKINNPIAKAAAYTELGMLKLSPEEFLEFMAHHYMANKPSHGMGAGMRKFIQKWYSSQNPHELAVSMVRAKKKKGWAHKDIIKMARVKSDNTALSAVLMACVRGVANAQEHFKDKIEAQQVLDYLACYKSFGQCRDPSMAVEMIKSHSFDIDTVPSELLQYPLVWVAAIEQSPLRRVLFHLKAMARRGTLAKDSSPVLNQLVELFHVPLALETSKLQPSEILVYHHHAKVGWEHPPVKSKAAKEKKKQFKKLDPLAPRLLGELNKLMKEAFRNVSKVVDKKVLVSVDTREAMRTNPCWQSWVVSSAEAAAMTCLSLVAAGCEVTLMTVLPDDKCEVIPLSSSDTMVTVCEKMAKIEGGVLDPVATIREAAASGVKYDLIVSVSDVVRKVNKPGLWVELVEYREKLGVNSKFVFLATSSSSVAVANPGDSRMLDIAGWTPRVVEVIFAFLDEHF